MKPLFFSSFLLLTIATAQDKPAWIDTPQSQYSNAKYLSAVGSGDTRKSAESDASAKLAMIFQSTIKAEQTINDRYKELFTSPQNSTYEQSTDVTKNTSISSNQILYNFQIAETFTDNLGRTYALAVIERAPTAEIYEKKIQENEKIMGRYIEQYSKTNDAVAQYADINAASVFSTINEGLKQQLVIIIPGRTYVSTSGYDAVKIQQMLADARKNLPFAVSIKNDTEGKTTAIVKEMLSEMGFVTAEKGVLTISGEISFEKVDLKKTEEYVRWSYALSVVDGAKATIVSLTENGREGHLTYSEAVARATRTMKQKIKTNFGKEINRYFDTLVKKSN
ncbi:MAG: LPP20 family lipoprotein [Bacteroidota bacterium]|nr:LPP20 family lipoprotein [Bacteroidota bacterium]